MPLLAVQLFRPWLYVVLAADGYLVVHDAAELFSIVVSLSIFGVGWFTHELSEDRHSLFLACAFLGVGLMDSMHAMSFPGMPDFFGASTVTRTSQYWLAARLFTALCFIASAFILPEARFRWLTKRWLLAPALAVSGLAFALVSFLPDRVPATFDPAAGLTPFKVLAEYVIVILFLLAIPAYVWRWRRTGDALTRYFVAAFVLSAYAELVLTAYRSAFDTFNALGHVYKVAAFCLVYRAVFVGRVQAPYLGFAAERRALEAEILERKAAEAALRSSEQELALNLTERVEAEERARAAALYARSLIEASLDPLVTISPEGKVTDVNRATEEVTGIARDRLVGTDFADSFTEPELARAGYRRVLDQGYVRDYPLTIRHASGRTVDVLYNATVYRDEAGRLRGVFATARDVTERKLAEQELARLATELERRVVERTDELGAANRELEAFVYSVSHDLRAPLRHIGGFIELLQRRAEGLDDQARHYATVISQAAGAMGTMIDDLLSFSRMGRGELSKARVDVGALVQDVLRELAPETEGRAVDWKVGKIPAVWADREMLRLAMTNLLANAAKFTRTRNRAEIEVGCAPPGERRETVIFVRDNGVGFDPKYTDKLFKVFQRLHRTEDFEGTGIGLANVRRIVERHGGRVWAEGALDGGATFFLSLPRHAGDPP